MLSPLRRTFSRGDRKLGMQSAESTAWQHPAASKSQFQMLSGRKAWAFCKAFGTKSMNLEVRPERMWNCLVCCMLAGCLWRQQRTCLWSTMLGRGEPLLWQDVAGPVGNNAKQQSLMVARNLPQLSFACINCTFKEPSRRQTSLRWGQRDVEVVPVKGSACLCLWNFAVCHMFRIARKKEWQMFTPWLRSWIGDRSAKRQGVHTSQTGRSLRTVLKPGWSCRMGTRKLGRGLR